jgi:hypothetical protein
MKKTEIPSGNSYLMRVKAVNEIYKTYSNSGLSNREVWRRYIFPIYFISENTFYNYLAVPYKQRLDALKEREK